MQQHRRPRTVARVLRWRADPFTEGLLFGALMVLILFRPDRRPLMDENVVILPTRSGPHFTPRETIDLIRRHVTPPAPTVINYQAIEGQGLRRQTSDGWEWVDPQDCIDSGTGEVFQINTAGFWKGCFVGGTAVLLLALGALAIVAAVVAERIVS